MAFIDEAGFSYTIAIASYSFTDEVSTLKLKCERLYRFAL